MMNNELKVRVGTPADVHGVMDLALTCAAENGLTNPNPMKLLNEVWAALNQDRAIIGVIGDDHDNLEAAIMLRVDQLWYSDDQTLIERAVIVRPELRSAKGGRARLLCDFAKRISGRLGIPLIIGVLSTQRAAGKVRLYERSFGPQAGAYWVWNGEEPAKTGDKGNYLRDVLKDEHLREKIRA